MNSYRCIGKPNTKISFPKQSRAYRRKHGLKFGFCDVGLHFSYRCRNKKDYKKSKLMAAFILQSCMSVGGLHALYQK
jgi:hypothetical protein